MTLCDPMDCNPPGSSIHGDSPGKNTRVGCHVLLQGVFLTQRLNPGLPHCRQILYHLTTGEALKPWINIAHSLRNFPLTRTQSRDPTHPRHGSLGNIQLWAQEKKGPEFSGHIAVYTAPDLGKWGKLLEGWFLYIEIYPGDILWVTGWREAGESGKGCIADKY